MWEIVRNGLSERTLHFGAYHRGEPASYAHVLRALTDAPAFRDVFFAALRRAPFAAYFWETPPVTRATADRSFEFVLADAPALARVDADPSAFADPLAARSTGTAVFENLGGDAILVAPCPGGADRACAHLATFARDAPEAQQHDFWATVATTLAARLGDRPVWLSTSGLGVPWLHVRLDARPKYYTHAPYRADE